MIMTKETLGREHRIHVSPVPKYFCGTLLGWEVDIISFNEAIESQTDVCGRLKTEEEAVRAGIEYVEEQLKSLYYDNRNKVQHRR
jgi:hypothetical protein